MYYNIYLIISSYPLLRELFCERLWLVYLTIVAN